VHWRRWAIGLLGGIATACGGSDLSGRYMGTAPGNGYDFRDGQTVNSMAGDEVVRGTYSVSGSQVGICIGRDCNAFRLDGDCLVDVEGARYCKEP